MLVVAPGIQLDWDNVPGLASAAWSTSSSNYSADLAPKTWELIKQMRSGTAVFTQPSGPIKCGEHHRRSRTSRQIIGGSRVLKDIRVVLILPTPGPFGVPVLLPRWQTS